MSEGEASSDQGSSIGRGWVPIRMPGQGELESDDGRNGLEWLERASHSRRGMQGPRPRDEEGALGISWAPKGKSPLKGEQLRRSK